LRSSSRSSGLGKRWQVGPIDEVAIDHGEKGRHLHVIRVDEMDGDASGGEAGNSIAPGGIGTSSNKQATLWVVLGELGHGGEESALTVVPVDGQTNGALWQRLEG
jgi:hypothetical protein